jgi:hypothetical protein
MDQSRPPCPTGDKFARHCCSSAVGQSVLGATILQASEVCERFIALELRAKRIYAVLAQAFAKAESARQFFEVLSQHEQDHADLLKVCWDATRRGDWTAERVGLWRNLILRLEHDVQAIESSLRETSSLDDALRLVIQIESSEINDAFFALTLATDGNHIRDLRPFREAMDLHIAHICQHIPELSPHLTAACRQLRARCDQEWMVVSASFT